MSEIAQFTIQPISSDPRFRDLTGRTFGRLHVIGFAGRLKGHSRWVCRCECGNHTAPPSGNLLSGLTQSCGCYNREQVLLSRMTHGHTINRKPHPLYATWGNLIKRCENPKSTRYKNWGGRGIQVCERWRSSFTAFLADVGEKPSPKHSLDRINNDGNYEPGNVRWVTSREQNRNRRSNHVITLNGVTQCLAAWAEEKGIAVTTLVMRINQYKWTPERAITTPVRKSKRRNAAL